MAGARCFSLPAINRKDLMSLTEECARVTGIPYLMDAYREEAIDILEGRNNGHKELESLGSLSNYAGTSRRFRTYE
jgi:DNA-directed RNA polymerase alpha subunit